MKDDRYEEAPLLVETSHLMKRIGVLSQIIIIIVIQGFGILAYLSILDPVAVGVGKENLVQLPDYVLLLQGSPATLTITWVVSPVRGLDPILPCSRIQGPGPAREIPGCNQLP